MFEASKVSAKEVVSKWGDVYIVADWLKLNLLFRGVSMNLGKEKKGLLQFQYSKRLIN